MQTKYERLDKNSRKKARIEFYNTPFGKTLKPRFTRLLTIAILLIIYGICLIIEAIIKKGSIWSYISAIIIFIFAIVFLVGRQRVIIKKVNDYLIKKK